MTELSRRGFVAMVGATSAAALLAGCSQGSDQAGSGEETSLQVGDYQSDLPVLYINVGEDEEPIGKTTYREAAATLQGNETYEDQYSGDLEIKGRGNSSWELFPKKAYRIKLAEKADLFGMGESKNWVLLADYLDESLMRTRFTANLAEALGLLCMSGQWVVLVLNGEYRGVYELVEQVEIGKGRVEVFDWEDEAESIAKAIREANPDTLDEDDQEAMAEDMVETLSWMTTGKVEYRDTTYAIASYYSMNKNLDEGYLMELSAEYDETTRFQTSLSRYKVMVKSPEYTAYNQELLERLKARWNEWDAAIHAEDGRSPNGAYYADLMDLQSAVDYWLVNEFAANGDAVKKSRYCSIGEDEKITFGPIWDFDMCLNPTDKILTEWNWTTEIGDLDDAEGWKLCSSSNDQNFFDALIAHEDFVQLAFERYDGVLKPAIEENLALLDTYHDYLSDEAAKNTEKWQFDRGFEDDYQAMKQYANDRYAWMNKVFKSEESLAASLAALD